MTERWLPIKGYEDFYSISDQGRVLRHARLICRVHTQPYLAKAGILAQRIGNKLGHVCVTLYDAQGKRRKFWVHRLVAEHFIPNPHGYPFVLHGPLGPAVNRASELRWGTQSDNEKDKFVHRLHRQEARER